MSLRALMLTLVLVVWPARAAAEPSPRARAEQYFDAGTQAFASGQYLVALRAYEAAHALLPSAETVFSMAQAARLAFFEVREPPLLQRALALYKAYLAEAPAGRRRAHAIQHIAAIEAMLALSDGPPETEPAPPPETMLLVVSRARGARARIDGGAFEPLPLARAVAPGSHRVEVKAPGFATHVSDWPALAGRLVVVPVSLRALQAVLAVEAPAGAVVTVDGRWLGEAPQRARLAPGRHTVRVSQSGHEAYEVTLAAAPGERLTVRADLALTDWRRASHWLFAGAGALAIAGGVSGIVALAAQRRALDLEAAIGRQPLSEDERVEHEAAIDTRDEARTAAIALGVGAAAAAASGLAIFLVDPRAPGPEHALSTHGLGLSWRMKY